MSEQKKYDVIVIGGGIVGLMLVAHLGRAGFKVALVERSSPLFPLPDVRVSAINRASRQAFRTLGLWSSLESTRLTPYENVLVWAEGGDEKILFESRELGEPNLGYVIENNVMKKALWEYLPTFKDVDCFSPAEYIHLERQGNGGFQVQLQDGFCLTSALIVGADGANSKLRAKFAGVAPQEWGWSHNQKAIVAMVRTELPHEMTARQRFLKSGPLVFLPLWEPTLCSIVWTNSTQQADTWMAASPLVFCKALEEAFQSQLGSVELLTERFSFPLVLKHAKRYCEEGIVFIGDAIHTIHPLAGLGLNLGIQDAVCLAKVLIDAREKNHPLGHVADLRRYERFRKGPNWGTSLFIESVKWFLGETPPIFLQQRALRFAHHFSLMKHFFARQALSV
ncbi:MAG: FAD-dependent monooxygenase [Gammaproteobacteria bacterium]|nr:FAD-dependent monooxygenase [Gammaproteobacteria bacterium]